MRRFQVPPERSLGLVGDFIGDFSTLTCFHTHAFHPHGDARCKVVFENLSAPGTQKSHRQKFRFPHLIDFLSSKALGIVCPFLLALDRKLLAFRIRDLEEISLGTYFFVSVVHCRLAIAS